MNSNILRKLICPPTTTLQLEKFSEKIISVLACDLVGIFLHGSLAMGCFNPKSSDIDILVVTEHMMDVDTKTKIAEILLDFSSHPHPIEISFLVFNEIFPFRHPLPYDFHYGESWRPKFIKKTTKWYMEELEFQKKILILI